MSRADETTSLTLCEADGSIEDPPPPLFSLPPELIIHILEFLPLHSLVEVTKTCRSLRSICSGSEIVWKNPLTLAAIASDCHLLFPSLPTSSRIPQFASDTLIYLGRSNIIPSRVWIQILPYISRNFLLYDLELPYLMDREWYLVCLKRFSSSHFDSLTTRRCLNVNSPGWKSENGRGWRGIFLRELQKLEHRVKHGCSQNEHFIQYLVLHRNKKFGLNKNRIATRDYSAIVVFERYKLQNGLQDYETVTILIPRHHCPPDLNLLFLVVVGKESSFLRNELSEKLLESVGWKRGEHQAILGPALITASIRHSPDLSISSSPPVVYVSLEPQDLFDILPIRENNISINLGVGF